MRHDYEILETTLVLLSARSSERLRFTAVHVTTWTSASLHYVDAYLDGGWGLNQNKKCIALVMWQPACLYILSNHLASESAVCSCCVGHAVWWIIQSRYPRARRRDIYLIELHWDMCVWSCMHAEFFIALLILKLPRWKWNNESCCGVMPGYCIYSFFFLFQESASLPPSTHRNSCPTTVINCKKQLPLC